MSRILRILIGVVAVVAVALGAVLANREAGLFAAAMVVLAALIVVALVARRIAVHETKVGTAEFHDEEHATATSSPDFFGDWSVSEARRGRIDTEPKSAVEAPSEPEATNGAAAATGTDTPVDARADDAGSGDAPEDVAAPLPEPNDPSAAFSRPIRSSTPDDAGALMEEFYGESGSAPNRSSQAPAPERVEASVGAAEARHVIDWTGTGRKIDERVRTSDDIMRASEATALPVGVGASSNGNGNGSDAGVPGSELARLLSKVEARLRDYD